MRRYYMFHIMQAYRLEGYYKNKREARKDFKNVYGVYPDEITFEGEE